MGLVDSIIGTESGGDPTAQNPNSSATGAGQFIASTWLDTLAKHRPDLTGSPDELLAMRNDPQLSKDMTAAYAADNGAILAKAGLPVTPATTYLAHFAGPGGAVGLLSADPAAPAGSILGAAAVKANPFLAGMTAGDAVAWANRKMGGQAAPAPTAAPPPTAPLSLAPQSAPIFAQQSPSNSVTIPASTIGGGGGAASFQAPAAPPAAPIFAAQRKPVDISKLKAAFKAPNFYAS